METANLLLRTRKKSTRPSKAMEAETVEPLKSVTRSAWWARAPSASGKRGLTASVSLRGGGWDSKYVEQPSGARTCAATHGRLPTRKTKTELEQNLGLCATN